MKSLMTLMLSLSISLILKNGSAQSIYDWEQQQTGSINDNIMGVQFLDSQKGWAIGQHTVLYTNDSGQNWVEQDIDADNYYLWEIFFSDSLHGWIVGGYYYNNPYGAIFHTNDGGQNWFIQHESDEWEFNGLQFIDSLRGWVVGGYDNISGPVILYTDNGGENWEVQFSSTTIESQCNDVSFCNDSTGWAVGSDGLVLNTTNGGNTWNIQNSNIYNFIRNVQVLSTTLIYACGSSGLFLYTYDGGTNWHHIPPSSFYTNVNGLYFLDSLNGWIVGDVGRIYYTTNGGMNWTCENFGFWDYFYDVFFNDSANGWIVGMYGKIYKTANGGGLFTGIQETNQNISDIQFSISPNPFTTCFELIFNINNVEKVQISIYDIHGTLIEIVEDKLFYRGRHQIKVDDLKDQPGGAYFIRIQSPSFYRNIKTLHIN